MIDEKTSRDFVAALSALCSFDPETLRFEIQDDWQFLLVSIEIPLGIDSHRVSAILRSAQELAGKTLPWRPTEYSWMVNAVRDGVIVESVFGGDRTSPHSGEIR